MASMIGSKVERKEDKKFLTGKGRYTADITLHNQSYAVFIRSPHARAKIKGIDTAKAKKASEVIETIQKTAESGKIGDGKIFALDLKDALRIRTGETGSQAL